MILVGSFFVIALLYATVGFGGGSSYIALLALENTPYTVIPKISLLCNLLVVSMGSYHFIKRKHFSKDLILPFVLSSAPMAFLGGLYKIEEKTFFMILTSSLILSGLRLLFVSDKMKDQIKPPGFLLSFGIGALLGLLSGLVGIGGGIFLSPLLINMGWARSKEAAAVASFFILINSLTGLGGQFYKELSFPDLGNYLGLFLAVLIGGQIGARLSVHSKISYWWIQKGTGFLTLVISVRLLLKALSY